MFSLYSQEQVNKMIAAENIAEGKIRQAYQTAMNLKSMGMDLEEIAQAVSYPIETVKMWFDK